MPTTRRSRITLTRHAGEDGVGSDPPPDDVRLSGVHQPLSRSLVQIRRDTLPERDDHSPTLDHATHNLIEFLDWFVFDVIFESVSIFVDFVDLYHVRFPFDLPHVQPQSAGLTILGHSGVPPQQLQERPVSLF